MYSAYFKAAARDIADYDGNIYDLHEGAFDVFNNNYFGEEAIFRDLSPDFLVLLLLVAAEVEEQGERPERT